MPGQSHGVWWTAALLLLSMSCGGGGSGSGGGTTPPSIPTGLTAAAGNTQVSLTWSASSGATSYHVKRSTTSGSGYTQVATPTANSYTDTGLTNGTPYYYVVSAVNAGGERGNSGEASATPSGSTTVHVRVDVLTNRHPIGSYVYGGSYPKDAATITDSGLSVVRWGGNATSRYNWKTFTYNTFPTMVSARLATPIRPRSFRT
jgi:hypothetical protein